MKNKNWNNYFGDIENKYNLKMNQKKPIVIFLDGKDVTKSSKYDLISENRDSFNDIFEQTIKEFTIKFDCIAILGVDEVSFIFENSKKLKEFLKPREYKAHEIVSMFAQSFYKSFNERYKNGPVYWHCKCSNIPSGKINSYINYRSLTILELRTTYFLKRRQLKNAGKIPVQEKKQICDSILEYRNLKQFEKGKLYISGEQIDLDSFFRNQRIKLPEIKKEEASTFLDLSDFDD